MLPFQKVKVLNIFVLQSLDIDKHDPLGLNLSQYWYNT